MKKTILSIAVTTAVTFASLQAGATKSLQTPQTIEVQGVAQNPEGIEYNKNDHTFFLSSLNATPIIKVNLDGTFTAFSRGEKFPLSTAGLQIDYKHNRLLVAGFNGLEIMDDDPKTKGTAFLRVYNLKTGLIEKDINLSHLVPEASAYFANDIAVDEEGNAYISDWYAGVIYKVDLEGNAKLFWKNKTGIAASPNGLDYHKDGYLLVSLISFAYKEHALIKIPLKKPDATTKVAITRGKFAGFAGFDGMVINAKGNIVGISNNQKSEGGNILMELSSSNSWKSATVVHAKSIASSTTLAITPKNENYVINQDFTTNSKKTWKIERIAF